MELVDIGCEEVDSIHFAQDMVMWRCFTYTTMNFEDGFDELSDY
jgi:hypothetical protein